MHWIRRGLAKAACVLTDEQWEFVAGSDLVADVEAGAATIDELAKSYRKAFGAKTAESAGSDSDSASAASFSPARDEAAEHRDAAFAVLCATDGEQPARFTIDVHVDTINPGATFIVMRMHSSVSRREINDGFDEAHQLIGDSDQRPMTAKHACLARFAHLGRRDDLSWAEILERWNVEHPTWRYDASTHQDWDSALSNFRRDAGKAQKRIRRPSSVLGGWPFFGKAGTLSGTQTERRTAEDDGGPRNNAAGQRRSA